MAKMCWLQALRFIRAPITQDSACLYKGRCACRGIAVVCMRSGASLSWLWTFLLHLCLVDFVSRHPGQLTC
eukprot:5853963-Pleurochrysis_carterae.AAC.1